MLATTKLALWALTGFVAITTVLFNIYIFLMTLWSKMDPKKHQRSPSEIIIMALSVADVTHQLLCYLWMAMDEMDTKCRITHLFYTVLLLLIYTFKFTIIWNTSFLTFYYSTKLVNTPNHCYTQIQAAILKHVTLAVFLIPLCGLATCMPMIAVFHPDNQTDYQDCGVLVPNTRSAEIYDVLYLLLCDVLPGVIMLKCCISISIHLAIHLHHMKANTNGTHMPKLGSQLRVIQMALSLVLNFIIFLVVDLYVNYQIVVNHDNSMALTFFVTSLYTTVTALVLIYGKKSVWKALMHDFNTFLDEYPCLSCLKVPEHKLKPSSLAKVKN